MKVESSAPSVNAARTSPASWRHRLITNMLRGTSAIGLIAVLVVWQSNPLLLNLFYVAAWLLLTGIAFVPTPYRLRSVLFLTLIYVVGLVDLFDVGPNGQVRIFFFGLVMLTLVLFNLRASLLALLLTSLTLVIGTAAMLMGYVTPLSGDVSNWSNLIINATIFILLTTPIAIGFNLLQNEFKFTQQREHQALEDLGHERDQLEIRVAERARTIERRTQQVAAGAEIASAASTELNPDLLIQRVVELIQERFSLYYVGVFLVDENNRYAILRAGTGEAGKTLLERDHRLEIGGQSMIGRAIINRQARIALDVGQEAVRFNNPVLPLTRSEMALPLIARERAIGALTIQSDQPEAFTQEDIISLQGMADLIAVALDNARLFREAQQALQEVSGIHRTYLSEAWETFARHRTVEEGTLPTYTFADKAFTRGEAVSLPEIDRAIDESQPIIAADEQASTVTVPITLRDQVIGAISIEGDSPSRVWSQEDLALIAAVLEQTALSLENARLIEETETALAESKRLASRERTVNTISSKIRRLPNVESVLTTALVELGRALGANKGAVRIGVSRRSLPSEAREANNE